MSAIGHDIAPHFRWNWRDAMVAEKLLDYEKTPRAIEYFSEVCGQLTDYGYWYLLGTLWVNYTGWSDLQLWKRLFASDRPKRKASLMKPSELKAFDNLPYLIEVYRAHRPGELDWISYSLSPIEAAKFAARRQVDEVIGYRFRKRDVIALFLRRGEQELIVLDPSRAKFVEKIPVLKMSEEVAAGG